MEEDRNVLIATIKAFKASGETLASEMLYEIPEMCPNGLDKKLRR